MKQLLIITSCMVCVCRRAGVLGAGSAAGGRARRAAVGAGGAARAGAVRALRARGRGAQRRATAQLRQGYTTTLPPCPQLSPKPLLLSCF